MTRKSQSIGAGGEEIADIRLSGLGIGMIEKIGTPVRLMTLPQAAKDLLYKFRINPHKVYTVVFGEKVSGDRRGIIPGTGRSVLIETKTVLDHNLRWSNLRPHQPERLDFHTELGGLTLLAWVHSSGVYVLQWPVPGFRGKGDSITPEKARELDLENVK